MSAPREITCETFLDSESSFWTSVGWQIFIDQEVRSVMLEVPVSDEGQASIIFRKEVWDQFSDWVFANRDFWKSIGERRSESFGRKWGDERELHAIMSIAIAERGRRNRLLRRVVLFQRDEERTIAIMSIPWQQLRTILKWYEGKTFVAREESI